MPNNTQQTSCDIPPYTLQRHETAGSNDNKINMSNTTPLAPSQAQARHWAKHYRTEIAASSSTVLATFVSVRTRSLLSMWFCLPLLVPTGICQNTNPIVRAPSVVCNSRSHTFRYPNGFYPCVHDVWKQEGFRGFWRGMCSPQSCGKRRLNYHA